MNFKDVVVFDMEGPQGREKTQALWVHEGTYQVVGRYWRDDGNIGVGGLSQDYSRCLYSFSVSEGKVIFRRERSAFPIRAKLIRNEEIVTERTIEDPLEARNGDRVEITVGQFWVRFVLFTPNLAP